MRLPLTTSAFLASQPDGRAGRDTGGPVPEGRAPVARADRSIPHWAVLRIGALGVAALVLAFRAQPVALAINLFWFVLVLGTAVLAGVAWARPRATVVAAEAVLAVVAVQGLWAVATPGARSPAARTGPVYGIGWHAAFTGDDQALMKTIPLPNGWKGNTVYLVVDLGTTYRGPAGFALAVNDVDLGVLDASTATPDSGSSGFPSWSLRLPDEVLDRAPLARIVLRPAGLDVDLSVAGHGDSRFEPLGARNSWFFDGVQWRNDRLAGVGGGPAVGTYRIWLNVIPGKG
jgi:hypothetical protein